MIDLSLLDRLKVQRATGMCVTYSAEELASKLASGE